VKILTNLFRVGLFENPYLDLGESQAIVGCEVHVKAGYEAQLDSVVMIKNKSSALPLKKKLKIYVPGRTIEEVINFVRFVDAKREIDPIADELLTQYFELAKTPDEADAAIVFIESPIGNGGFNPDNQSESNNGYEPISLQYRPYEAKNARPESIAGGDPREKGANRSYHGKTSATANETDLDNVINTKKALKDRPVIVCIRMKNPAVLAELEPYADAILVDFGVQKSALLDIITGECEPTGRLPIILPNDMDTVERHCEDLAFDMEAYADSEDNVYSFGFGLSFSGVLEKSNY